MQWIMMVFSFLWIISKHLKKKTFIVCTYTFITSFEHWKHVVLLYVYYENYKFWRKKVHLPEFTGFAVKKKMNVNLTSLV